MRQFEVVLYEIELHAKERTVKRFAVLPSSPNPSDIRYHEEAEYVEDQKRWNDLFIGAEAFGIKSNQGTLGFWPMFNVVADVQLMANPSRVQVRMYAGSYVVKRVLVIPWAEVKSYESNRYDTDKLVRRPI